MEISTGAHGASSLSRMRGDIGILFGSAEAMGAFAVLRASPSIASEVSARSVGQADFGIARAGQVVIVRRSLLKRKGNS
jgi:hypothetical protein